MQATDLNQLRIKAQEVLRANDMGAFTKPAPGLYPHQWNWDSCFIAIGLADIDPRRAAEELWSLLRGQWDNGLVPQIVFNPGSEGYFPGPDVWQSDRSPDAPRGVQTSGITQPPVLATAALRIWQQAPEEEPWRTRFLQEIYPRIVSYHRFLYEERNPDGSGLIVVVHPWESGLDNSPPYLDAGRRVHLTYKPQYQRLDLLHVSAKNRPTDKDYDLFVWLIEQMRGLDWDQRKYLETAPLQVQDVLFNSILARADLDLAEIARIVGEDPGPSETWHIQTSTAINDRLWDEADGTYYSFDRVAGELLRDDTIAGFLTLYGHVATDERAGELVERHLLDPTAYWPVDGHPVPTAAMSSSWFNAMNYWLGPVWVNMNWMILHGLDQYGHAELAREIAEKTVALVASQGFREYFNPLTGEGYGTDNFSWTAALTLDLLLGAPE